MSKLFSGRFFLTVICGLVFFWASIRGQLSNEAIAAIIATVFQAYFNRTDRTTEVK